MPEHPVLELDHPSGRGSSRPALIAIVLFAAISTLAADKPPVRGSVCITASKPASPPVCAATLGDKAAVPGAGVGGTYVWRRADGAEVALGHVPLAAKDIVWPERWTAVRIRDDGKSGEPVVLDITAKTAQWQFALTEREARALRRIAAPEDNFTINATAAHRRPAQIHVTRDRLTYELVLAPVPSWSGRVIDKKTRKGVTGVMITAVPQEVVVATTDYTGNFRFEVPVEWPASLRFTSGAYGVKTLAAPPVQTDAALPWVELLPAGAIALELEHDADVDAELWHIADDETAVRIVSRVLRRGANTTRFEGLDEGEYEIRLRGTGPLERYSTAVTVREGEVTTERIRLEPVPLEISVMRDDRGVPDVKLILTHMDPRWETDVVTDASGRVDGPLWQQGLFVARASQPGKGGMLITRKSVEGTNRIDWRIDLAGGMVAGVVVDAEENFPISRAKVYLETKTADNAQQLKGETDDQGNFQFTFVPEGAQTISLSAVGYLSVQQSFSLTAGAPERRLRFELVPAELVSIRVVDSYGRPLVGATITDGTDAVAEQWVTNAEGRASVPFRRGESKTLFVLPREGSIAVATLSARSGPNGLEEQQITVPKAEATIDIRTQDPSGDAVPDVELLLRYNGVLLPQAVTRMMLTLHGNMLRTGAAGGTQLRNLPIGYYEFWPFFSLAQFQQLQRGPLPPGTAIGATPGNNSVILTFERTK